jgi:thiol-disulfide isomerase/thioredoxin
MKRIELTVAVLAATILLAYLAGHRPRVSAEHSQKGSEASAASSVPDLMLKDLEGRDESLGQFKGKVVLVNFWATWCTVD